LIQNPDLLAWVLVAEPIDGDSAMGCPWVRRGMLACLAPSALFAANISGDGRDE
jgi:hypothetical protein